MVSEGRIERVKRMSATNARRMSHIRFVTPRLFWWRREGAFSTSWEVMREGLGEREMWANPLPVRRCIPSTAVKGQ